MKRTLTILSVVMMSCVGDAGSSSPLDDAAVNISCVQNYECPPGQICHDELCTPRDDTVTPEPDAGGDPPRILVSVAILDFGAPLMDTPVLLPLTIANIGGSTLEISEISIEENDSLAEFRANPRGELNWELEPAGSMDVSVTLHFQDLEEDHGNLVIQSNDPRNPVTRIPLTSELKGDPILETCVLVEDWTDPFEDCNGMDEVRYSIHFGDTATRYVSMWNAGDSNLPLEITGIQTAEETSFFDLTVLDRAGDEIEFPRYLNARGYSETDDYIMVRVDFTGTQNTYVGGELDPIQDWMRISSSWEDHEEYRLLLEARVVCPENCDGLFCDQCCTPTGPEICDGEDNDCDGLTDEDPFVELCTDPPLAGCLADRITYRSYGPLGLCVGGGCDYTGSISDVVCNDGNACTADTCPEIACQYAPINCSDVDGCTINERCDDGECVWDEVVCNDLPDAHCEGTNIIVYEDEGVCVRAGSCQYLLTNIPCSPPENATATCRGAECGFACNDGYEECDGECCLTDRCSEISNANSPSGRLEHSAVWTGSEMIVWGGDNWRSGGRRLNDGGRYNPETDTWRSMNVVGGPGARISHVAFWTGTEMIVWGGTGPGSIVINTGSRYDPTTDTWTPMSIVGAPISYLGAAVWTGTEMVVWGGSEGTVELGYHLINTGARYNPEINEWSALPTEGAPSVRYAPGTVWTGTEMIVWGGQGETERGIDRISGGGRYNPVLNTWLPINTSGAPPAMNPDVIAWTGTHVVIWSSRSGINLEGPAAGALYDPLNDSWTAMNVVAPIHPDGRLGSQYAPAIWDGFEVIVYPGGRYDPIRNLWSLADMCEELDEINRVTSIWTGEEVIFWGSTDWVDEGPGGIRYWPPARGE